MANMLYNGVELPDIESVWTDKGTYPYARIQSLESTVMPGYYCVIFNTAKHYYDGTKLVVEDSGKQCFAQILVSTPEGEELAASEGATLEELANSVGLEVGEWGLMISDDSVNAGEYDETPVIWSNYDILNTDGSVYLAASTPVPVGGLTPAEFFRWFQLGQAVRRGVQRVARMWSYNGVVLPKLPEWDKSKYPYAYIADYRDVSGEFWLYVTDKPLHYASRSSVECITSLGETVNYKLFTCADGGSEWVHTLDETEDISQMVAPIWCNTDMDAYQYGSNTYLGYVALSASDPVPVYE